MIGAWLTRGIFYSTTCVITPNFVALGQNVLGVSRRSQKFLETLGPAPLRDGTWLTLTNTLLYNLCYYATFGHSRSKQTNVLNGDPPEKN